jgi:hypothetical protein
MAVDVAECGEDDRMEINSREVSWSLQPGQKELMILQISEAGVLGLSNVPIPVAKIRKGR